jgi:hypothetical protein
MRLEAMHINLSRHMGIMAKGNINSSSSSNLQLRKQAAASGAGRPSTCSSSSIKGKAWTKAPDLTSLLPQARLLQLSQPAAHPRPQLH